MPEQTLAIQLAKKIKLEDRLKPNLRRFFKRISKDVGVFWTATRSIPSLDTFNLELVAILRDHYRAVARAFSKTTRSSLKSHESLEIKQEENIDKDIVDYINTHSQQQSNFILRTTEKDLRKTSRNVIATALFGEVVLTPAQVGKQIEKDFNESSENRIDTIAVTETQTPSEAIKFIEAAGVASAFAIAQGTQQMFKTWNTVLDEKTRASHVQADRQRVPANQPFTVQGQRLKVPGDTSLGATLDNVIHCRCSAIYNVEGEESPPLDIPRQFL